jgi:hypothetical protein
LLFLRLICVASFISSADAEAVDAGWYQNGEIAGSFHQGNSAENGRDTGSQEPALVAAVDENRGQHGGRPGLAGSETAGRGDRAPGHDHRPEALVTKAKKAISAFRLREGMEIGCKVTLRGRRMYEFLDRLISLALPRVRDFRGLSPKAFDGHGNYSLGLSEQLVFPEIDADKVTHTQGMHISLVTTAETDEEARVLLKELGMPFTAV